MKKKVFLFGLILSGCTPFSGYEATSEKLITHNWAPNKRQPIERLYCYQVLGGQTCVHKAIPGKDHLLIGQHVPAREEIIPPLWERMNLHPLIGVDANTIREELELEPIPSVDYKAPIAP